MSHWLSKISEGVSFVFNTLCLSEPPKNRRWILALFLSGLYLGGILWFGSFYKWGNFPLEFHDWAEITAPRLTFLKTAMMTSQVPYHVSDPSSLHGWTSRFLAVSDTFFSPQMILLRWQSIQDFSLTNTLLLYTLGFAGLLLLRSRLKLSAIAFTPLFMLFNFNGNILSHLGVGHETWTGYFLFPFFVWLVLRLADGDHSWAWILQMASLLFIIWLQGSFHQYVWLLLFLGLLGVFIPRTFWMMVRAGIFTLLLSAFRILPATLMYGNFSGTFVGGYFNLSSMWDALVNTPNPIVPQDNMIPPNSGLVFGLPPWETTCFIGLLGVFFLIYFGIYRGMIASKAPYRQFILPLAATALLSFGSVYGMIYSLRIPILMGERVTSRILSVALVFGLVFAAERFQGWLDENRGRLLFATGIVVGLVYMYYDLLQNQVAWRLPIISLLFNWSYFDPQKTVVKNDFSDTIFLQYFWGGLAITVLVFAGLAFLAWREARMKRRAARAAAAV